MKLAHDFPSVTLAALNDVARELLEDIKSPVPLCLFGDLGAGKTTFARAFIVTYMGESVEVVSPTFTLLQTYESSHYKNLPLTHFDLYRLTSSDELYELGFEDFLHDHITLIEWPERMTDLPTPRYEVYIEENSDETRHIKIIRA